MQTHADHKKETKSQTVARTSAKSPGSGTTLQFVDNRKETATHQKMQTLANKSSQVLPSNSGNAPTATSKVPLDANKEEVNEGVHGQELSAKLGKRSKPQMQEDVNSAKREVQEVIKRSKTTAQVAEVFPWIKAKYHLKHIGFNKNGLIDIEINPKAQISDTDKLISSGVQPVGDRVTDVTYTTAGLGGSVVGTKMVAKSIGPNHPQGGPPKSSAQKVLMGKLTTTPKNNGEDKYIKGHLLNDNIGGPGVAKNLFPITAIANKKHHDEVESQVKKWVNNKGYWVHYEVAVTGITEKLDGSLAENFVNASFTCIAYPLTATGGESKEKITKTINSKKGKVLASGGPGHVESAKDAPAVDSHFGTITPEVSTSKTSKIKELDADLQENIKWIFEEGPEFLIGLRDIKGIGEATYSDLVKFLKSKADNALSSRTIGILNGKEVAILAKIIQIHDEMEDSD